jgi:protein-tyrosine phosphatase
MTGFVDIHSHILWGLDDGARDFDTSMAMLRIAAESGTTDIVATPHSDLQYSFQPDEMDTKIAALSEAIGPLPRIHRGCDFHLHFDNIQDCFAHPAKYTINHRRYLMVEFSDQNIAGTTSQVFERMNREDITPVITHPERNALLMKDLEQMVQWVQAGCLVQVTSQSFLGRFGKQVQRAAEELMSRGLVHFIASDAHDPEYRPPSLRAGYAHVLQNYGTETADRLFITNPAATLTGEYLEVEAPELPAKRKKWFQLW